MDYNVFKSDIAIQIPVIELPSQNKPSQPIKFGVDRNVQSVERTLGDSEISKL